MAHVPAAERRVQLIRAAIDLMTREGLAAGNTRAIAAELGVAQATVHYAFGTKEELYIGVLQQLTTDLAAQVERAAPADGDFAEAMAALAAVLWRTVQLRPANYQLLHELSMLALRTPRLSQVLESHYSGVLELVTGLVTRSAVRTGQELECPAQTIARLLLAGLDGLTLQRLALCDEEAEVACLRALVSSVVALADGRARPVPLPLSQEDQTSST
ncbi:TetR/AcrR family transcriptional regulator [Streptomyces parvulus]|uniref:TetR/AcrR family transcriptional regulator n=1 Tax=Streptomyces parvulus TaxID=146923 RepID=UPI00341478B8